MPLHGLGVRRHSQHRPGLPMRQSWCPDGQYQCPGCLWPSPALCRGCWPQACTQARPQSAQRTWQPSNTVTVSTAGRLQPGIGAGYRNNRQDILSYTCPQVTLTLSPVPLIFPAAHNRGSYWRTLSYLLRNTYLLTAPEDLLTAPEHLNHIQAHWGPLVTLIKAWIYDCIHCFMCSGITCWLFIVDTFKFNVHTWIITIHCFTMK